MCLGWLVELLLGTRSGKGTSWAFSRGHRAMPDIMTRRVASAELALGLFPRTEYD
jgi:hypothetical protein